MNMNPIEIDKKAPRDISFDIAKGIGMLMVILGHLSIPAGLSRFVFSFHMPLFFLINGYFFNKKELKVCVKSKFRTLIIPYIVTCILVIISSTFWNILRGYNVEALLNDVKMWIFASLYGSGTFTDFLIWHFRIIGAIWFLLAMFWADVIFDFLLLKTKFVYVWALVLAFIGYITADMVWLPLSFQAGLTALIFIEIGYYIRQRDLLDKCINNIWVLIAALAFWINSIINGGQLYMVTNHYGNGIFDILGALGAFFIIIRISKSIAKYDFTKGLSSFLSMYGRNSLIVLSIHLVELNTFPWGVISNRLPYEESLIIIYFLKVSISVIIIFIIPYIPILNKVFGKTHN